MRSCRPGVVSSFSAKLFFVERIRAFRLLLRQNHFCHSQEAGELQLAGGLHGGWLCWGLARGWLFRQPLAVGVSLSEVPFLCGGVPLVGLPDGCVFRLTSDNVACWGKQKTPGGHSVDFTLQAQKD